MPTYVESKDAPAGAQVTSAARGTTGTGTAFDSGDIDTILGTLTITAVSGGTPTLVVNLETTVDGTNWYVVGSYPSQNANQAGLGRAFSPVGRQCRWQWTIGGSTPSFTFAIVAKETWR